MFVLSISAAALAAGCGGSGREAQDAQDVSDVEAGKATDPAPYALAEYTEAVRGYTSVIRLLQAIPPTEEHQMITRAVQLLAAALERVPADDSLALEEAARLIRGSRLELSVAFPGEWRTAEIKDALHIAAGALHIAAEDTYNGAPAVLAAIAQLEPTIAAIDPQAPLRVEREDVVRALEQMALVLQRIQDAAVRM